MQRAQDTVYSTNVSVQVKKSSEDEDCDGVIFVRAKKVQRDSNITSFFEPLPEPAKLGRPQKRPSNAGGPRGIFEKPVDAVCPGMAKGAVEPKETTQLSKGSSPCKIIVP